jgi:hypothetical protein
VNSAEISGLGQSIVTTPGRSASLLDASPDAGCCEYRGLEIAEISLVTLRSVRRSAGLAEDRMEYLREERDRLTFL